MVFLFPMQLRQWLPVRPRASWAALALLCSVLLAPLAEAQVRPHKATAKKAAHAQLPTVEDPPGVRIKLFQAATLQNNFKDSEALAMYQEILTSNPNHYLALWQGAVLSAKIGGRYSDETRKSAYFDAARQYADRALALQPEGGESNYAVAVALFNQATLYKAGARLVAFRDLRSHVYLATERRPDLPEAWALLGRWKYRVAHYNVIERIYSKLVLGGVPAGGNSRDAMECMETARKLAPQNLQFCYYLARMCRYQGRRQRAIEVLREAEKITPLTSEDLVISRLCRQMLPPLLRAHARRQRRQLRTGPLPPPAVKESAVDSTRVPVGALLRSKPGKQ